MRVCRSAAGFLILFVLFYVSSLGTQDASAQGMLSPKIASPKSPPTTQQAVQSALKSHTKPSPLSSFVAATVNPPYVSTTIPDGQLVSHRINLRAVLNGYAKQKKCSSEQAFERIVAELNMVPMGSKEVVKSSYDKAAIYQVQEADNYLLTAPQKYFNALESKLHSLTFGNRQIVVEVRFLQVPYEMDMETVYKYAIPGSFKAHGNQLPQVMPIATNASENHAMSVTGNDTNRTFVVARAQTSKAFPTIMAEMTDEGVRQLIQRFKNMPNADITQAPTVTMFPEQSATIHNESMRPFVVDVESRKGDFAVAHQPIIQILEDGSRMVLNVTERDGKTVLAGDLAFCKVVGVETYQYPEFTNMGMPGEMVSVQVPEHRVRTIHLSTTMDHGNTILIDPVESKEIEVRKTSRFKKQLVKTKVRQLIMITPRWVESQK